MRVGFVPGSASVSGSVGSGSHATIPVEPIIATNNSGADITSVTSVRISLGKMDELEASLMMEEMEKSKVRAKLEIQKRRIEIGCLVAQNRFSWLIKAVEIK